jgi:hypothetical protein
MQMDIVWYVEPLDGEMNGVIAGMTTHSEDIQEVNYKGKSVKVWELECELVVALYKAYYDPDKIRFNRYCKVNDRPLEQLGAYDERELYSCATA